MTIETPIYSETSVPVYEFARH